MKVETFLDRDEWHAARLGKITGSRLSDILVKRGTAKKITYYKLIAERVAIPDNGDIEENAMDRGSRLEPEALARLSKELGEEVNTDLRIWSRDDNDAIAISPDGTIGAAAAAEVKCLSSADHIKAFLTQEIPNEYKDQALQYFVVNDKLNVLYFVFYDPRVTVKDFFYLTMRREDVQTQVDDYLAQERALLAEIDADVNKLTF